MSLGLNRYSTDRPTDRGMTGAPIQPMDEEDARFWSIFHARRNEQEKRK